jgi:DNA-binding MarR family transcriptional regulator
MSKTKPAASSPVDNITSIFTARRDLRPASKALVQGSKLSVEEADLLVLLYGLRKMGWKDCRVYDDGYVNFSELKTTTVYDPSLFTRRINKLKALKLLQVRSGWKVDPTLHGKSQQVRIEDAGITAIKPIWDQYNRFCEDLLKDFSAAELKTHLRVNEAISDILQRRRDPAQQLLGLA